MLKTPMIPFLSMSEQEASGPKDSDLILSKIKQAYTNFNLLPVRSDSTQSQDSPCTPSLMLPLITSGRQGI